MKNWKQLIIVSLILLSLVNTGCSRQVSEVNIDMNQMFFSITGSEYSENWTFSGEEGLSYVYAGLRENILDYLIVKSEDPLAPSLFIFLKVKDIAKADVVESVEAFLKSLDDNDGINIAVDKWSLHQQDDYYFYIVSSRAEVFKNRIIQYVE